MAEEGDSPGVEDVFGLVANDTRFGILQALWEHERDDGGALPFSALHDAVDVRDSGQFNYHLDKLVPRFVREGEDGYELAYAGEQVIGAVTSGTYTRADAVSVPRRTVGDCPECEGTLGAEYESGYVDVSCDGCELTVMSAAVPPVLAAGYDAEELPVVFSRYTLTEVQKLARGFCTRCDGRVDATLERTELESEQRFVVVHTCRECGESPQSLVAAAALDHPALICFLYDHGMDVRTTPLWDLDPLFEADCRVVAEDPLRVAVSIEVAGETLELTLDETLSVVEHARSGTKP